MSNGQSRAASIIGWDIGGAHLKAARIEGGEVVTAIQVVCRLWMGLDHLDRAFSEVVAALGAADTHAVTMTGELTDVFPSRAAGVRALAARAGQHLGSYRLYAGPAGFIASSQVQDRETEIASANWHGTAMLVGRLVGDAVLIDMGSTTTDVIPVRHGRVAARGFTDAERLATGELIYTGATRTALMAFTEPVPFRGRLIAPMPEYFAVIADIHRILGTLPDGADMHDTTDNGPKTVAASRLRLSRVIGIDVDAASSSEWEALAAVFAERQLRRVHDGVALALSGSDLPSDAPVIACGTGRFIIEDLCRRLQRPYIDLADVLPVRAGPDSADLAALSANVAPAVAMGILAG